LPPLGVAANPLLRVAPFSTDSLFDRLCSHEERASRADRLDEFLRLAAVTEERRARLASDGRDIGPVTHQHLRATETHYRIESSSNPLHLPARYASTLAYLAPELFAQVVRHAGIRLQGASWENLAVITHEPCDLPIIEAIELAVHL
jgi:hypothetical protein